MDRAWLSLRHLAVQVGVTSSVVFGLGCFYDAPVPTDTGLVQELDGSAWETDGGIVWESDGSAASDPDEPACAEEPWRMETVDGKPGVGQSATIAIDSRDGAHIAYYDPDNRGDLRYAYRPAGGSWALTTVDEGGSVGLFPEIAIGPNGEVFILYDNGTDTTLRLAQKRGRGWDIEILPVASNYGLSLAVDPRAEPHIAFVEQGELLYGHKSAGFWNFERVNLDTRDVERSAFTLLPDGTPVVTYEFDQWIDGRAADELRLARRSPEGLWVPEIVDQDLRLVGTHALDVDPTGELHIAYISSRATEGTIRHARQSDDGTWLVSAFTFPNPDEDTYPAPQSLTLVLSATGRVHLAYILRGVDSPTYVTRSSLPGSPWDLTVLSPDADDVDLALDSDMNVHLVYQYRVDRLSGRGSDTLQHAVRRRCR